MARTGRPKSPIPTAEVQWRVPVELIEFARGRAETKGMTPGEWLTHVLTQLRDQHAAAEARGKVVTRFKESR